jgi:hypothetical protein
MTGDGSKPGRPRGVPNGDWKRENIAAESPHPYHDAARHPECGPFEKQKLFHESRAKYRFFGGAAGPGKSRALLEEAVAQALKFPGVTTAVFRSSYPELQESIISKFLQHIHPQWTANPKYKYVESEHTIYWPNGSRTLFRHCANEKDAALHLGAEYLFIGIDELTMLPYVVWKLLTSRLRCPVAGTSPNAAGSSNPGGIGSDWVKSLFIDHEPCMEMDERERLLYNAGVNFDGEGNRIGHQDYAFIPALISDNPIYANDANYMATLESLPQRDRERFLIGSWDHYKGSYFENYNPEVVTLDHDRFLRLWGPQYWQPIWISIDWGSTHHAYASWHTFVTISLDEVIHAQALPAVTWEDRQRLIRVESERARGNGPDSAPTLDVMITFREHLTRGLGEEALAEEVVRLTPQNERPRVANVFLSPDAGFDSPLMRGSRIGEVLVRRQMPRARAAFNPRVEGWTLMREKLGSAELRTFHLSGGEWWPEWCVTGACPNALKAIPWAVANLKPGKDGDILAEGDSPLLDVLDGLRYGIASYSFAEQKPAEERKRELLARMPRAGAMRFTSEHLFKKKESETVDWYCDSRIRWRPWRRH